MGDRPHFKTLLENFMVVPPYLVLMYRNSSAFSRKLQEQLEKKAAPTGAFFLCVYLKPFSEAILKFANLPLSIYLTSF